MRTFISKLIDYFQRPKPITFQSIICPHCKKLHYFNEVEYFDLDGKPSPNGFCIGLSIFCVVCDKVSQIVENGFAIKSISTMPLFVFDAEE